TLTLRPRALHWQRGRAARGGPGPVLVIAGALVALLCLIPPIYLAVRAAGSWENALDTVLSRSTLQVTWNTISLAVGVTACATAIALPMAWLVERSDLPGRRALGVLAALPLAIPSYVGAMVFVAAFSPRGLVQGWLEPLGVERLPSIYGLPGAVLVLTLFTYPYL